MKHTPEQIRAAKALINAKVALWSASTVLEAELGFDVDSGGQHLEDAAVVSGDRATDSEARALLRTLKNEAAEQAQRRAGK